MLQGSEFCLESHGERAIALWIIRGGRRIWLRRAETTKLVRGGSANEKRANGQLLSCRLT